MKRILSALLCAVLLFTLVPGLLGGCAVSRAEPVTGVEALPAAEPVQRDTVTVRAKVPAAWGDARAWAWSGSRDLYAAWPGELMERDGDCFRIEIPTWVDSFIVNGCDGAAQTDDLAIQPGRDVWITVSDSGAAVVSYDGFDSAAVPDGGAVRGVPGDELTLDASALRSDYRTDDNNRVFYEIFVGSFSDSDGDGVGDLRGVINRMDYLNDSDPASGRSLGVEGIWLTPIFLSPSYHKYDVTDYYTIDPAFGTLDDLRELCELCEARNVKLILDLVLNHTGNQNAWFESFKAAHRNGDTSGEWYDFYSWCPAGEAPAGRRFKEIPGCSELYECNFSDDMPELNYNSEAVREKVLEIAKFYLDLGVDGFRFDAVKYVYYGEHADNAAFWTWYADELRKLRSDIYLVGEVWDSDSVVERYYGAFNCFNFSAAQNEGLFAKAASGDGVNGLCSYTEQYLDTVRALRGDATIVPFLSNHDTDRAAGYLPLSNGRAKMAANLYLLSPGTPFLYYGEEIGMKGSRGSSGTDANRRLAMLWGDGDTVRDPVGTDYPERNRLSVSAAEQVADPNSLYSYYKQVLLIRAANPEIARGDYRALANGDGKVGGFVSVWNGSAVCVVHNASGTERTVDLSKMTELSFERIAASIGQGEAVLDGAMLSLGPQTSAVLR